MRAGRLTSGFLDGILGLSKRIVLNCMLAQLVRRQGGAHGFLTTVLLVGLRHGGCFVSYLVMGFEFEGWFWSWWLSCLEEWMTSRRVWNVESWKLERSIF
jgi:hypothetical protein